MTLLIKQMKILVQDLMGLMMMKKEEMMPMPTEMTSSVVGTTLDY